MTPSAIHTLRARLGLTVEKFAALLGVSSRTVFRWESGEAPPDRGAAILLVLLQKAGGDGIPAGFASAETDEERVRALVLA